MTSLLRSQKDIDAGRASHIQRDQLRTLLQDVRNVDAHPEATADAIINYINANYDLKDKVANNEVIGFIPYPGIRGGECPKCGNDAGPECADGNCMSDDEYHMYCSQGHDAVSDTLAQFSDDEDRQQAQLEYLWDREDKENDPPSIYCPCNRCLGFGDVPVSECIRD